VFFLSGLAIKAIVLSVWKLFHLPAAAKALGPADPLAFAVAERLTASFFSQRRIVPTLAEGIAFELFLVLAFGLECLLVGYIIRALVNLARGRRG
jgi:hypothetical protein